MHAGTGDPVFNEELRNYTGRFRRELPFEIYFPPGKRSFYLRNLNAIDIYVNYFSVGSASPEIPPIEILRIIMKDQNVTDDYLATIDSLEMLDEIRSGFRNKSEEILLVWC